MKLKNNLILYNIAKCQIYFHEKEPRCLHQWNPHDGKSISSFFFLDDLTKPSTDAYWKYALTGAAKNTEFKIWDCGTWDCLQTVVFTSSETYSNEFIAEIDRTSSYLILSSIEHRNLYILQIINDNYSNLKKDNLNICESSNGGNLWLKKNNIFIKSISEFPLSSPILSFSVVDAAVRKYKCALSDTYLIDELDDYDEENNALYCIVIRMFIVQPKSVQECHVLYQPTLTTSTDVKSSLSDDNGEEFHNDLTNMSSSSSKCEDEITSVEKKNAVKQNITDIQNPKTKHGDEESIYMLSLSPKLANREKESRKYELKTPESFTAKKSSDSVSSEVLSTILMLAGVSGSTAVDKKSENLDVLNFVHNKSIEDQEKKKIQRTIISKSPTQLSSEIVASGGSSPSREVQEILSLKNYKGVSNFYEIPHDTGKTKTETGLILNSKSNITIDKTADSSIYFPEDKKGLPNKLKSTVWPTAPDFQNINNPRTASSTLSSSTEVNNKLNQLIGLLQAQSNQIKNLQNEVLELNTKIESIPNMKDLPVKLESRLIESMEQHLIQYQTDYKMKLDEIVSNRNINENVSHILSQFVLNQLSEKLGTVLITEFQRHIIPITITKLDILKQQIQNEMSQTLTSTDRIVRESITQMCRSKHVIDVFGSSILAGVQSGLQTTYVESMTNVLIPAYEKSSQEMFKQLHETFSLGIKEVMEQFDTYISQVQPVQDGTDEIVNKISDIRKKLDSSALIPQNYGNEMLMQVKKEIKTCESNIIKATTQVIHDEIKSNFESQTASLEGSVLSAVRSQAHTPAPTVYDAQDQIKHLLYQGQVNKAFHQALLANDLSLVEYTLEKAEYSCVFNPCVLEQTVLLSLIQQIAADMSHHNNIKQRYLADSILNLNKNDPITKEHAPKVMRELYRNCQSFLASNPQSSLCSNIKMIIMAIQGLGYKIN